MKLRYKIASCACALVLTFGMGGCLSTGLNCAGGDQADGITAYDLAVQNGFQGTEQEWLESLKGKDGDNAQTVYLSLYDEAVEKYGYTGTFYEFVAEYMGAAAEGATEGNSVSKAADKAVRSAVSIFSTFTEKVMTYDRWGNVKYNYEPYEGAGSGVIVSLDENGNAYVITNFHVIYDSNDSDGYADKIDLYVFGRELETLGVEATIVGASATYDIAVLKVTNSEIFRTSNLLAAQFANSDLVGAGDEIFAVGNPEAAGLAVTSGIVSVDSEYIVMTSPKDNRTGIQYRVIRIDAAVNGGNSGGGLFDLNGNLVGIVNAKVVSSEIDNIAYAIPSVLAQNVYKNIIANCDGEDKTIDKSVVGITVRAKDSCSYYDPVLDDVRIKQVVEIASIEKDSLADGKFEVGDIVESFVYKGQTYIVDRVYHITDYSLLFSKGEQITFNITRGENSMSITLTLGDTVEID